MLTRLRYWRKEIGGTREEDESGKGTKSEWNETRVKRGMEDPWLKKNQFSHFENIFLNILVDFFDIRFIP